jgi:hypothetical protein
MCPENPLRNKSIFRGKFSTRVGAIKIGSGIRVKPTIQWHRAGGEGGYYRVRV